MATEKHDGEGLMQQKVVVLRHGDRIDQFNDMWLRKAADPQQSARPWDPPLAAGGFTRAWATGRKLRRTADLRITRVVVSPFKRCLQTASEVVAALCAVVKDDAELFAFERFSKELVTIDTSRIKVSIEYGLCEVLNEQALREFRPKETESWFPDLSELEDQLPEGSVDHDYKHLLDEMPEYGETVQEGRIRCNNIIQAIADMYPEDNILLVTHGEAVGASVTFNMRDSTVFEVDYCGYSVIERQIPFGPNNKGDSVPGEFKVVSKNGTYGVQWAILSENA